MKIALLLSVLLANAVLAAADRIDQLTEDLSKPWDRLIVSLRIEQKCTAPVYFGTQFRVTKDRLSVATWKEVDNKETLGPEQPATGLKLEELRADVLRHYKAAVVSLNVPEHIATLPTEEMRKMVWARVREQARGFQIATDGIDIRIYRERSASRYRETYGPTGLDDLQRWLREFSPKPKS